MTTELKVPYLGTAEEDVLLSHWFVAEGEAFTKGQVLAAVETLKASFDVEAAADGVLLRHVVAAGERVELQAVIGLVGAADEQVAPAELDRLAEAIRRGPAGPVPNDGPVGKVEATRPTSAHVPAGPPSAGAVPSAAPAARRLAKERGIDLARVRGTGPDGLIRLEDVQEATRSPGAVCAGADGRVEAAFLAHVRSDRVAFGALASGFKVELYRQHGAILGTGTELAPGAVLLVDHLVLGADCHFGPDTLVEASELLAGDRVHFGRGCRVHCRKIGIGDDARFAEGVEVGGPAAGELDAELVVGRRVAVAAGVSLDPSHRLELGDDVDIARNAMVTTHFVGGSPLRGFPVRHFGVRIGRRSHIGAGATVLPGVDMGEGAVLLPNSTLVGSPPAGRMFGGVPAVDLQQAAEELTPAQSARLARDLVLEFARRLQSRGGAVDLVESEDSVVLSMTEGRAVRRLHFGAAAFADDRSLPTEDVRVAVGVDDEVFAAAGPDVCWLDLSVPRMRGAAGTLASAFCEFLDRRGVRLGGH